MLIYWHVEKKSMFVHSQRLSRTSSEATAMVEGAVRHGTSMQLEGNCVGSLSRVLLDQVPAALR